MKHFHCVELGCKQCKKATRVGKNWKGKKLYTCKNAPAKHRSISAQKCGQFKCKKRDEKHFSCVSCDG